MSHFFHNLLFPFVVALRSTLLFSTWFDSILVNIGQISSGFTIKSFIKILLVCIKLTRIFSNNNNVTTNSTVIEINTTISFVSIILYKSPIFPFFHEMRSPTLRVNDMIWTELYSKWYKTILINYRVCLVYDINCVAVVSPRNFDSSFSGCFWLSFILAL